MNIQIGTVLSDLSGTRGMGMVRAMVGGERDANNLADFRDPRVKASRETIVLSLQGTWQPEQVAILKRQLADWDAVQKQIRACDQDLKALMRKLPDAPLAPGDRPPEPEQPGKRGHKKNGKSSRHEPGFDLGAELKRVTGVDLTRIVGVQVNTIQTVIAEAGLDMSRWLTENHFVSWLGLSPRHDTSAGKVPNRRTRKVVSRLATALRMAASSLRNSDSYLGAQFRRLRTRLGAPKALTAMAAKLARLIYRMLRYGQKFVEKGAAAYEKMRLADNLRH